MTERELMLSVIGDIQKDIAEAIDIAEENAKNAAAVGFVLNSEAADEEAAILRTKAESLQFILDENAELVYAVRWLVKVAKEAEQGCVDWSELADAFINGERWCDDGNQT